MRVRGIVIGVKTDLAMLRMHGRRIGLGSRAVGTLMLAGRMAAADSPDRLRLAKKVINDVCRCISLLELSS